MAYGVKRGMKAPGEFGLGDMFGLALAGAAGIVAALVTDYQQQGETSALFTINRWVVQAGELLGFGAVPLWMVVVGMTAIGAGSIFYFQPITRQGAFAQGFGLLAVLMTATPADLAGGIEAINNNLPGLESPTTTEARLEARIINANYTPADAALYQVQDERAAKYDLVLTINFPGGLPEDVDSMIRKGTLRGRLHNSDTDETWNLFRSAGGTVSLNGESLVIRAGVPARSNNATLYVRIECAGFRIEEASTTASLGQTNNWTIPMQASTTPLFIQRLGKSYWF